MVVNPWNCFESIYIQSGLVLVGFPCSYPPFLLHVPHCRENSLHLWKYATRHQLKMPLLGKHGNYLCATFKNCIESFYFIAWRKYMVYVSANAALAYITVLLGIIMFMAMIYPGMVSTKNIIVHMLEICIPVFIWWSASYGYPLFDCQELKAVLTVAATVRVSDTVLAGYHILALVPLNVTPVLCHYHW